jgi:hypothetical protein
MSNLKSPYLIGLAGVLGLGVIAAAAIAADGPKVEKRDVVVHLAPPAFTELDANKDGVISQSEFDGFNAEHRALPEGDDLPPPPPPPGGKRMRMAIMGAEGLDTDKDGKISFAEFSGPMKMHFEELDANKDGVLDENEQPKDRMFERRLRK